MTQNPIQPYIADDMRLVDAIIRQSLHSEVSLVNQVAEYIVNSGGKRLRPALVLLSAGLFGNINEYHHRLAAIVEFIHTATLLHDDVVDDSSMRRGRQTANAMFGNAASVLVGDFVYSRAFQMMVAIQNMRVMEVLAQTTNTIAEGEVLQLLNVRRTDISNDDYLQVIRYKTAKLFEAATRLGAIVSKASTADEAALATYGLHLGTAFQLIDDVLDFSGDASVIGKNLGDDLAEGKPTLPLLYAMRHSSAEHSQLIRQTIEQGGQEQLPEIIEIVKKSGALEYVQNMAEIEAGISKATISHFPEGQYKQALLELAEFSVHRKF